MSQTRFARDDLTPDGRALDAFRTVLAELAGAIDDNLEGTVADLDPECLHDLRIAVRRTRSVLGQAKGVVPDDVRGRFGQSFRWLGAITTPPRDLDVYALGWDRYVSPLGGGAARHLEPVRAELERRRAEAHRQLAAELQAETAAAFLTDWRAWLGSRVPPIDRGGARPVGPFVARRIKRLQRRVLAEGRAITPDSPPERLHELRKDAKKLRYMLECFEPLLAPKARKRFVRRLKGLQDNLGEHQDADIHLAQLRELTSGRLPVDSRRAVEQLADHLLRRRLAARAEFADRFSTYDTKANRRVLEKALRPARQIDRVRTRKRGANPE